MPAVLVTRPAVTQNLPFSSQSVVAPGPRRTIASAHGEWPG